MANWTGSIITDKGRALEAKVHSGKSALTFTKMALGDGNRSEDPTKLTDLVNKRQDIPISGVTPGPGTVQVRGTVTNEGVENTYYMRELGLYAKDPDEGEILYSVTFDNTPDVMVDHNAPTRVSTTFTTVIAISDAESININFTPAGLTRIEDVQALIKKHNTATPLDHPDRSVTTAKLASASVTTDKLASASVTADKLAAGAVSLDKLQTTVAPGVGIYTRYNAQGLVTSSTNTVPVAASFTGGITAPTRLSGDNTTNVATTEFVTKALESYKTQVQELINNSSKIEIRRY